MVALTAFSLGAAGQVMPGRLLRHTVGGLLRPAAAGLQVVSGCLAGPANTQGELALVSNTQLTVQPFRAVVQNSQDLTAGAYLVPSETVQTFTAGGAAGQTIPAQDASQFRRALVTLHVDDAQVAGSGGNASTLEVLPGALAATAGAAVLPAIPANALNLGELLIPPTGQTVTVTPYNPRTGLRGGILPVVVDGSTIAGHDGAAGLHNGQYRDHPTYGLQRWDGTSWVPGGGSPKPFRLALNGPVWVHYPDSASTGLPAGQKFEPVYLSVIGREVKVRGLLRMMGNVAAGDSYVISPVGAIPAAMRPTERTMRSVFYGATGTTERVDFLPDGSVVIGAFARAYTSPQFAAFDCSWNVENNPAT